MIKATAVGKLYHASPHKFKIGDMIEPRSASAFLQSEEARVYLTDGPYIHYTLEERAKDKVYWIYEVAVEDDLEIDGCWDSFFSKQPVMMVDVVGSSLTSDIGPEGWNDEKPYSVPENCWWVDRVKYLLDIPANDLG